MIDCQHIQKSFGKWMFFFSWTKVVNKCCEQNLWTHNVYKNCEQLWTIIATKSCEQKFLTKVVNNKLWTIVVNKSCDKRLLTRRSWKCSAWRDFRMSFSPFPMGGWGGVGRVCTDPLIPPFWTFPTICHILFCLILLFAYFSLYSGMIWTVWMCQSIILHSLAKSDHILLA